MPDKEYKSRGFSWVPPVSLSSEGASFFEELNKEKRINPTKAYHPRPAGADKAYRNRRANRKHGPR